MFSKIVVLLAAVAFASAGYLQPAPAFHAAPLSFAAPAISRVEHLPPAVASSYKTEVFTPPAARTYEISPAVTHFAPAPIVAPAPAPLVYPVPQVPRIAHFAPAVHAASFAAPAIHHAPLIRAGPVNFGFGGLGYASGFGHGLGYASGFGHGLGYASGFGHGLGYSKYY
ncbi:hypothetical protein FQR65_LT00790 [Abscondita terminalis]|nr:hypothetical protein FQR65_LT00790 [Abscondita terminalis]